MPATVWIPASGADCRIHDKSGKTAATIALHCSQFSYQDAALKFTALLSACYAPFTLALVICILAFFNPELSSLLQFDRQAILAGEWWRLWSGHLLHTNSWHLLMNLAGLVVIIMLHGNYYRGWPFVFLVVAGFGLSGLALLFWSPETSLYVGLSGWLHALLVYGACEDVRRHWSSGWLILAGVAAKVGWEQWQGASNDLVMLIEADVAVDAHLYGAICGVLLFAALFSFQQIRQRH